MNEYVEHYYQERPHQAFENALPLLPKRTRRRGKFKDEPLLLVDLRCRQRLGGLLKHYHRTAA